MAGEVLMVQRLEVGKIQTANPETVKSVNRTITLDLVRQLQPISRADIARVSGLNRSTISAIVYELLEEGLLVETGPSESGGRGRPGILLQLNADNMKCIVIDVGVRESRLLMGDVLANIECLTSFPTPCNPNMFVRQCCEELDGVFQDKHPKGLRGITISLPGLIDRNSGLVCIAPNLGWYDLDLGVRFAERYGLPVYVENEAKLCAIAEMYHGATRVEPNYAFISVTEGLGVGLVLNNELYQGVSGAAGEFGHMLIDPNGPRCGCGKHGCWETFASETASVRYYLGLSDGHAFSPPEAAVVGFERIISDAKNGDVRALSTIERMSHYLGVGIANIVNGLNLKLIIMGGRILQAWNFVEPVLHRSLAEYTLPSLGLGLRVEPSSLSESNVIGAIVRGVSSVFEGITLASRPSSKAKRMDFGARLRNRSG